MIPFLNLTPHSEQPDTGALLLKWKVIAGIGWVTAAALFALAIH